MSEAQSAYFLPIADIERAFADAAPGYDAAAVLQQRVRTQLVERLDLITLQPQRILEAGVGTGASLAALRGRFPAAHIVALDLADSMLAVAREAAARLDNVEYLRADCHDLPLDDGSVDLIFSNLMLHCCHDPERVLAEFRRVLTPGGLLSFTTYGPDTLQEMRRAWASVDSATHVHYFYDMHDIGDALQRAGFAEPVMDMDPYTLTYQALADLMRDLKALGERNASAGRPRGLLGRGRYAALEKAYERFRVDDRLPATFEVIFGHAWAAATRPARRLPDGAIAVDIAQIGRAR